MNGVKLTPSLIFLLAVNLLPLLGVVLFGWDVVTILVLYWLESVIIGVLNIPKILACKGGLFGKLFLSLFFSFHYGMFTLGHGTFLKEFFGADLTPEAILAGGALFWTPLSFLVSHFVSMIVNFFGKREYAGRDANAQMFLPYGRVVVMHIVVLFGGIMVQTFGAPIFALILLIVLKTGFDLAAHKSSHDKAQRA